MVEAIEEAGAVSPPVKVEPVDRIEREDGPAAKLKLAVSER